MTNDECLTNDEYLSPNRVQVRIRRGLLGQRDFDIRTSGFIRHSSFVIRPYSVFKYSNTARRCSSLSLAGKLCPDALLPGRRVSK